MSCLPGDRDDRTVVQRFAERLECRPDEIAVDIVGSDGIVDQLSYRNLYLIASRAVRGFQELGINRHDRILIGMPSSRETLGTYLGALYAGVVPLMVPEPSRSQRPANRPTYIERLACTTGAKSIVLRKSCRELIESNSARRVDDVESLLGHGEITIGPVSTAADIAHLQATSGSTGDPKVAIIHHRNINANVRAIGKAIEVQENDRIVSWLPLGHDMGLICLCCAWYWGRRLILTDAANFVRNPVRYWLQLITDFGGTISPAPTSAYQVCSRLARRREFKELDLSRWRVAFCGSEPVYEKTWKDFQAAFASSGFKPEAFLPVYGLAEATLAVTIPSIGRVPEVEKIARTMFEAKGRAIPCDQGGDYLTTVSVGNPISGHSLRIVTNDGQLAREREVGEIEFAGPSVIDAYWKQRNSARIESRGDYLCTGDIGYIAGGRLFITGRKKDVIICAGRNLIPHQIEFAAAAAAENATVSGIAAVGVPNNERGTEELHLLLESAAFPFKSQASTEERIRSALWETFAVAPARIHWVRKGLIPKTSNGKIQRYRCREVVLERVWNGSVMKQQEGRPRPAVAQVLQGTDGEVVPSARNQSS